MKKVLIRLLKIFTVVLIFIVILAITSANYLLNAWGELSFSTVLYQLLSPLKGTNKEIIIQYVQDAVIPALMISVGIGIGWFMIFKVFSVLRVNISGNLFKKELKIELNGKLILKNVKKIKRFLRGAITIVLGVVLISKAEQIGIFEYINDILNSSTIFEEQYVKPESDKIHFGDNTKNLIYIYMESMETTYSDRNSGGEKDVNYIPNLMRISSENISFSHNEKLGGLLTTPGTSWTMAALLGSTSGIPFKLPINGNSAGEHATFLPGAISLGEVLQENGYVNYFMCGSEIAFGGRESYLNQHGDYVIFDYDTAVKDGLIDPDYYEFWGFGDRKLYEYAKIKLNEIAGKGEKFNFTMLTIDTHHPEGHECEFCPKTYDEQYANVISCADAQIDEFLEWMKQQSWYEDTTIVIAGDHASMNNTFFDNVETRSIYNCFINSAVEVSGETKNRKACVLDMFPTTLAAMGVEIEEERLGMGTNLFSERQTLMEEMGEEEFNKELARYSKYYMEEFVKGE